MNFRVRPTRVAKVQGASGFLFPQMGVEGCKGGFSTKSPSPLIISFMDILDIPTCSPSFHFPITAHFRCMESYPTNSHRSNLAMSNGTSPKLLPRDLSFICASFFCCSACENISKSWLWIKIWMEFPRKLSQPSDWLWTSTMPHFCC